MRKFPPKLVFLTDFALADANDLETVERQELIGLDRMGPDEMGDVQHVPPPMAGESIHGLAHMPGQGPIRLGTQDEQKRQERLELVFDQGVISPKDRPPSFNRGVFRQEEIFLPLPSNGFQINMERRGHVGCLRFLEKG